MRNGAVFCVRAWRNGSRRITRNTGALIVAVITFAAVSALAQTNASKASTVGTWKVDLQHSQLGPGPAPKSITLTILKDTPQMES